MTKLIPFAVVLVMLVGGFCHGLWTDRWDAAANRQVEECARRIGEMPLEFGGWEGEDSPDEVVTTDLQGANVMRRYTNRRTRVKVGVLFASGHARNVAQFHTPTECYPAAGWKVVRETKQPVNLPGCRCTFNVTDFCKKEGHTQYVRVFWAWSGDGTWEVSDQARLAFGRFRVLAKLYVTRPIFSPSEPVDTDDCLGFIEDVVPEFRKVVFGAGGV